MLFAADVLSRNPGATIIYDVKSTGNLNAWITKHGGNPLMWKSGHSLMKAKMRETGALLAGELSGHIFFKDRWYGFDDGLYAGARLLEYGSRQADLSTTLHNLPNSVCTPEIQIKMKEGEAHQLVAELQENAHFEGAIEVIDIDGLRVEYPDGFGLIRASNTTPTLVLRFEAENNKALDQIKNHIKNILLATNPHLSVPP
jgi:phosphomannomutase/phosphoglucomutase